jgi:trk system potassium uptake protein TrkA
MEVSPPENLIGRTLLELNIRGRFGIFVMAVKRENGGGFVFLPGPDYKVRAGDNLVMIGKEKDLLNIKG